MKKHIEILGWLYIVFGALGLFMGLAFFLFFAGLALLPDDAAGAGALLIIGWGIGGLMILTSVPGIIGGIGLLKGKSWSRILVLILGVLNLIEIPFGTVLGIYTLWVLLNEEAKQLLSPA
jgi:hypothetical protein